MHFETCRVRVELARSSKSPAFFTFSIDFPLIDNNLSPTAIDPSRAATEPGVILLM
ncbi:hypothetical protein X975_08596, partial [Stegodyphus mimosarum]